MNFEIQTSSYFDAEAKRLAKKRPWQFGRGKGDSS